MFPIASRGIYAPFNQVMGDAFLYWDANKTDTFTDLTTNGNNATQNTLVARQRAMGDNITG